MIKKANKFDVINYLDDEEMIQTYLDAAQHENDPDYLVEAVENVKKARQRLAKRIANTKNQRKHS